jgi:DNA-binding Xre family transcriptional regulator
MLKWHVKEVAAAKGMSLKVLAQRSGVSSRTIGRICQYPLRYGKTSTLVKLARALEVPPSAILEDVPPHGRLDG